jgi:hypothetical protein
MHLNECDADVKRTGRGYLSLYPEILPSQNVQITSDGRELKKKDRRRIQHKQTDPRGISYSSISMYILSTQDQNAV